MNPNFYQEPTDLTKLWADCCSCYTHHALNGKGALHCIAVEGCLGQYLPLQKSPISGLILHGGNEGDCLHAPWSLPLCPWNAVIETYYFLPLNQIHDKHENKTIWSVPDCRVGFFKPKINVCKQASTSQAFALSQAFMLWDQTFFKTA